jgi:Na+-transporting methylmalonyl-CoA/oxaloacetate decarboxylase beta subunit
MQIGWDTLPSLLGNAAHLNWANLLMMAVGGVLIYLAIAKEYAVEPTYVLLGAAGQFGIIGVFMPALASGLFNF